jgi:hypothetical protein
MPDNRPSLFVYNIDQTVGTTAASHGWQELGNFIGTAAFLKEDCAMTRI